MRNAISLANQTQHAFYFDDFLERPFTLTEQYRLANGGYDLDSAISALLRRKRLPHPVVRDILQKPFVVWTRWATAQGRSKKPRYYGFIEIGGKGFAELLVSKGLARTKGVKSKLPTGEKSKVYAERLNTLERETQQQRVGIWADIKK